MSRERGAPRSGERSERVWQGADRPIFKSMQPDGGAT